MLNEHCLLLSVCQDEPALKEEVEGASCAEAATTAVVDRHCEDAPALATEGEDSTRDHLTETDVDHGLMLGLNSEDRAKEADDHNNLGLTFGLNTEDRIKEADVDDDNQGLMFGLETEDHMKETDGDHGLESFSYQPSAKGFYAKTSSYSRHQLKSPLSDSSSSSVCTLSCISFFFVCEKAFKKFSLYF